MGLGCVFLGTKLCPVINNIFGEAKLALRHVAKAPNPMPRFGPSGHPRECNINHS